jgi:deazaflavin-dependent oxidoreductase (nitroreductase family)
MVTTEPTPYAEPGWITRRVMNPAVRALTRAGISVWGSRELRVRGRRSGEWRSTVVNVLDHDGGRYLVAPRGETQWVRNLRAAGGGELRHGRHLVGFTADELADDAKGEILRAYLRRWKFEVGMFFQGVGPDSSEAELAAITGRHPIFLLHEDQARPPA